MLESARPLNPWPRTSLTPFSASRHTANACHHKLPPTPHAPCFPQPDPHKAHFASLIWGKRSRGLHGGWNLQNPTISGCLSEPGTPFSCVDFEKQKDSQKNMGPFFWMTIYSGRKKLEGSQTPTNLVTHREKLGKKPGPRKGSDCNPDP